MLLLIAITGMPGAGKSTAATALDAHGYRCIVMGDVIREETKRRGLEPNQVNTGQVMLDLREKYGAGAVAELCVRSLRATERVVVIDGIRSMVEVEVFRRAGKVMLLAVHASRARRFALLTERKRSDAPLSQASFDERDARELSVGVGNAIALADECLVNERSNPDDLARSAVALAESWVSANG
jgi:dephospho-CoA kinase